MSELVITNSITLDGVMQSPSHPVGSGELSQSLMQHGLVDECVLSIHPLVLGSGRRLFPEGSPFARLRLVDSVTTTTGVVIGTFRAER